MFKWYPIQTQPSTWCVLQDNTLYMFHCMCMYIYIYRYERGQENRFSPLPESDSKVNQNWPSAGLGLFGVSCLHNPYNYKKERQWRSALLIVGVDCLKPLVWLWLCRPTPPQLRGWRCTPPFIFQSSGHQATPGTFRRIWYYHFRWVGFMPCFRMILQSPLPTQNYYLR